MFLPNFVYMALNRLQYPLLVAFLSHVSTNLKEYDSIMAGVGLGLATLNIFGVGLLMGMNVACDTLVSQAFGGG